MLGERTFRVMVVDLEEGRGERVAFGERATALGGSGLAAALYETYGLPREPAAHPAQPLIFAIGPLTGLFPLMSKVVCAFKSPYHEQYAESHAGGRLALALRFAGLDALVVRGRAPQPACLVVGAGGLEVREVHYLWGSDVFATGKQLRRLFPGSTGHRSILRIGPAGENQVAFAGINVDTYRHFGRLGAGSVMGAKRLKGIVVAGDDPGSALPEGRAYAQLYREFYRELTTTELMSKYHDLGTAANLTALNEQRMLPWRNLRQTHDPAVAGISGERFAEELLLRQSACAACPIGCIHMGLLRERFAPEHQYHYRQVSYDYEPIFAMGTMLGVTEAPQVLALLEASEREGLDVMSAGVALAWATEAFEHGLLKETDTLTPLAFGDVAAYEAAIGHLGGIANEFYAALARGTRVAAQRYGGLDFACLLGQEMAGYATGEVFFTAQALGFRHSHLDTGGYSYDQRHAKGNVAAAVDFLVTDERERVLLTSMVACLFARGLYTRERLGAALESVGGGFLAADLPALGERIQRARWRLRFATGFAPEEVSIPPRLREVVTVHGPLNAEYLDGLTRAYATALREIGSP